MAKKPVQINEAAYKERCLELLRAYTRHKHVKLVSRGNAAIFTAFHIAKRLNPKPFILIPDQGGWFSYKTYPKMLGFDIRTINTNRGVIDLMDLERKAQSGAAFIVPSFGGYFAKQSMQYIYNICKKNDCLLIEDASGSLADKELCDGACADIIIGSFGKWKIADAGYGGFISTKEKELIDEAKDSLSMISFRPDYPVLLEKLEKAPERLSALLNLQIKVKSELTSLDFKVVHPDLRGINVVVRYADEAEKERIIEYCDNKGFEYVQCPNYIRLEEEAISIELKRLQFGDGKKKK